jgi:predicted nucleic acid-binding protein
MKSTADRAFLDTNVLIYLYSVDETGKREAARKLVAKEGVDFVVSTQVLGEFSNVLIRKFGHTHSNVELCLKDFADSFEIYSVQPETIYQALSICERERFSFWDSMILSAALESDCSLLLSEDLQHNQQVRKRLTILNPFVEI